MLILNFPGFYFKFTNIAFKTTYVSFKPDKVGHKNSQKPSLNTTYVSFKHIEGLIVSEFLIFKNNPLLTLNLQN